MRVFTTITDEERATITAQRQKLGWSILGLALVGYVGLLVGFSYASPQFIASVQPYLFNPPDFSKCEPGFSARVTAHIVFAHLVVIFCVTLMFISLATRHENGQLRRVFSKNFALLLGFTLFAAIPVLSQDFLLSGYLGARHIHIRYHFVDFCARSWDSPAMTYMPSLGFWLIYSLVAIIVSVGEFVWSGNRQWSDSLDTDPEIRAEQLAVRLEYGAITQEEFDKAAKQFHLK